MIEPHGGYLVDRVVNSDRADQVRNEISGNPILKLKWGDYQDLINIGIGRFSPLKGFLTKNDFLKVVRDMTLEDGTIWSIPIILDVDTTTVEDLTPGEMVGLQSPDGRLAGAIEVSDIYKVNKSDAVSKLFGTGDTSHPGVSAFLSREPFFVGGPVTIFGEFRHNEHDLLPAETRVLFRHREWETVVGFQTRNAPHRAHEYIQRSAMEHVDGLLVQPKIGNKKLGDYRDETIMGAYNKLIKMYYRSDRVALSVFPSKMRYAGPREAIFDAIVRKNQGCTHFVVGRDHAGVDDYYGEFEAQQIFDSIGDIGINVLPFDYAFYCEKCASMTSENICPHGEQHRTYPSGTKIRQHIREGKRPDEKMMRPEVADYILQSESPFVTKKLEKGATQ